MASRYDLPSFASRQAQAPSGDAQIRRKGVPGPTGETDSDHNGKVPPLSTQARTAPRLGATFIPGGADDYEMPEFFAPMPQRVLAELPANVTDCVSRMELEAREPKSWPESNVVSPVTESPLSGPHEQSRQSTLVSEPSSASLATTAISRPVSIKTSQHNPEAEIPAYHGQERRSSNPDVTASQKPPPTDRSLMESLMASRARVLHSNDVSTQLTWAKQTLNCVDRLTERRTREGEEAGGLKLKTPANEVTMRNDAMSVIQFLVNQRHPEAVFMRAKWDEFGKFGYPVDQAAAMKGYRLAAEQGYGRAEYRIGMLYEADMDISDAIIHYNIGCKHGDSAAQYRMGMVSLLGQHGQPRDSEHGIDLIRRAADGADEDAPQAAYVFGMLIARDLPLTITVPNELIPWPLDIARAYIEKAASLGFARAQLKLGTAYELCQLNCDFDPALSLHYYTLAAHQGTLEADLGMSRWLLFGFEGSFDKDEALAYKYAKRAADGGLATGQFAMGYYYEIGIHIERNLTEARRWYELAAQQGDKNAQVRLESLAQSNTMSKKDHQTTTLNRIKTMHGSQRGKRPERFKQTQQMPTLAESDLQNPGRHGMRLSPRPTPQSLSSTARSDQLSSIQPSAAANPTPVPVPPLPLKISQTRSRSAAPYPEDETHQPAMMDRTASTAPYPEDDVMSEHVVMPGVRHAHVRSSSADWTPQAPRRPDLHGARGRSPHQASTYRLSGSAAQYSRPSLQTVDRLYDAEPPKHPEILMRNGQYGQLSTAPRTNRPVGNLTPESRGSRPAQSAMGVRVASETLDPSNYRAPRHTSPGRRTRSPAGDPHRLGPLAQSTKLPDEARVPSAPRRLSPNAIGLHERPSSYQRGRNTEGMTTPHTQHQTYNSSGSDARRGSSTSLPNSSGPKIPPKKSDSRAKPLPEHPDGRTFGGGPATFDEMGIGHADKESECVMM